MASSLPSSCPRCSCLSTIDLPSPYRPTSDRTASIPAPNYCDGNDVADSIERRGRWIADAARSRRPLSRSELDGTQTGRSRTGKFQNANIFLSLIFLSSSFSRRFIGRVEACATPYASPHRANTRSLASPVAVESARASGSSTSSQLVLANSRSRATSPSPCTSRLR
jgi:hypothetical protein